MPRSSRRCRAASWGRRRLRWGSAPVASSSAARCPWRGVTSVERRLPTWPEPRESPCRTRAPSETIMT
eukprot:631348-Prymnesium_polylepis.1